MELRTIQQDFADSELRERESAPCSSDCYAERRELIELGKRWLEHAPPPATSHAPGLVGFRGKLSVCVVCTGRILGRGCRLKTLADEAVWEPDTVSCDLC